MNLSSAVISLRKRLKDTETSNMVSSENLSEWVDASRKTFLLEEWRQNLGAQVASLVEVRDASAVVTATLTTPETGLITLTNVPQEKLYATYFFQRFTDEEIEDAVKNALSMLRDYTLLSQVPKGLEEAVYSFAASKCYEGLAASAAQMVLKEIEGTKIDYDKVSEKYRKLSADAYKAGEQAMGRYYADASNRTIPSFSVGYSEGNVSW